MFHQHSELQKAAAQNDIKNLLELLNSEMDIDQIVESKDENPFAKQKSRHTAFFSSLLEGQLLASRILQACGADSQKAILCAREMQDTHLENSINLSHPEPEIILPLIFWSILNHKPILLKKLLPHLIKDTDRTQGFIELAAFCNNTDIVNTLIKTCPTPRRHSVIRTAAYWAAKNKNNFLFDTLTPEANDRIIALWQLQQDNLTEAFATQYERSSARIKFLYKMRFDLIPEDETHLRPRYQSIYQSALRNKTNDLTDIPGLYHCHVTRFSLQEKNFVALITLTELIRENSELILEAFENQFLELIDFELIANTLDPYQLAFQWHKKYKTTASPKLKSIINFIQQQYDTGFLQSYINRNLESTSSDEEDLYIAIPKSKQPIFELIVGNLRTKMNDPGLHAITSSASLTQVQLQETTQAILNQTFKQFGLTQRCGAKRKSPTINDQPKDVLKTIFKFLYQHPYSGEDHPKFLNRYLYILTSTPNTLTPTLYLQKMSVVKNKMQPDNDFIKIRSKEIKLLQTIWNELETSHSRHQYGSVLKSLLCVTLLMITIGCCVNEYANDRPGILMDIFGFEKTSTFIMVGFAILFLTTQTLLQVDALYLDLKLSNKDTIEQLPLSIQRKLPILSRYLPRPVHPELPTTVVMHQIDAVINRKKLSLALHQKQHQGILSIYEKSKNSFFTKTTWTHDPKIEKKEQKRI